MGRIGLCAEGKCGSCDGERAEDLAPFAKAPRVLVRDEPVKHRDADRPAVRDGIRASDPDKVPVIYLAHPVSGDVPGNVARAKRWLRWATKTFPPCAVIAPWIMMLELGDDDSDPSQREANLRRCEATARCCWAVMLVGGRVSAGMLREAGAAEAAGRTILDFTWIGDEPPVVPDTMCACGHRRADHTKSGETCGGNDGARLSCGCCRFTAQA